MLRPEAIDVIKKAQRYGVEGFYVERCAQGDFAVKKPSSLKSAETWLFIRESDEGTAKRVAAQLKADWRV